MRNLVSQQLYVAELLLHTPLVHPQRCCKTVLPVMMLQPLRATVGYPLFLALEPAIVPTPACQRVQGDWYYHFTSLKEVQVAEVELMQEAHPVLHPVPSTLDDLFLPG